MPNLKFENRAVAFIDILGFKQLVERATEDSESFNFLDDLCNTLKEAVPILNGQVSNSVPEQLIPYHTSISDCLILSAPLTSAKNKDYCGLSTLIMRVIQLTRIFLKQGYLIRGGISIGKVSHNDSNIVGPAYQTAYLIETQTQVPRIELSKDAEDYWLNRYKESTRTCLYYRGRFMVNGLYDYYYQSENNALDQRVLDPFKEIINEKINTETSESIRFKWWWFKEFLNWEEENNPFIIQNI